MHLRKTAMGLMAASALVLSVAATPAMGFAADDSKPTPKSGGAVDQKVLRAEKGAAKAVDASLERDLAKINTRIAKHAAKTGYKNTFGSYVDGTTNKIVIETDASS